MEEPKDRLRVARAEAGFKNPTEAARAIREINLNTLTSNENGNRAISRKAAEKYGRLFGVDPGWLLYGTTDKASGHEDVEVPLVSLVAAGALREQPSVMPTDIDRYIRVCDLPKGEWIALTVEGDSMNRVAPDGAVIIVNRADDTLVDGRYYVFSLGGGEATFKRYRRSPERLQPFSTNPDHLSIPVTDDLYVFGRVRRVIHDV